MRRALTIVFSTVAFVFDELARMTAPAVDDHPAYLSRDELDARSG